ncbi:RNA polymerase sigma-I factor [Paenibacillus sp. sgz302251]|uniref:RNA polymerase sigma-I factor n=1 Tax=Paenibacillus sp. sgz302251 TaxID=3414493 RepID=UPI003C797BB7
MLADAVLKELITQAQQGNEQSRQQLIHYNKPFVERATSKICKRIVSWNDDEMSIGLIALNEAIDRYESSQNDNFHRYATIIIHSRLIDYYRKEGRQQAAMSLDALVQFTEFEEFEGNPAEIKQSWQQYHEQKQIQERVEEIHIYSERLEEFGIYFEELEDASPDRADARGNLVQIAYEFVQRTDLVETLLKTKQLPLKQVLGFTNVSRKTVERGRKYLIALIVILIAKDLPHLTSSIVFPDLARRRK